MPQLEQLKAEIKDEEILHNLASAFTEVSAAKIGVLKKKFEKNQSFFEEVSDLYRMVKASNDHPTTVSKGVMAIAMTTNHRFYGVINLEVMKKFLSETKDPVRKSSNGVKRMVVGKIGISYLRSIDFEEPLEKMVLDEDVPKTEDLKELLETASHYQKVLLFYPQFKTVYTQTPAVADIAYSPARLASSDSMAGGPTRLASSDSMAGGPTPATQKEIQESPQLVFEPELPKIVEFFETQIRTILLQRVLLEMELSVTASRLQAMSRAKEHAQEVLHQRREQLTKKIHSQINARLLESLGRVSREIN
jgi:ATP synthase F1 gamma subunit